MADYGAILQEYLEQPCSFRVCEAASFTRFPKLPRIIQQLIDRRHELGLTQNDLAVKVGMSQGDISDLERGMVNPTLTTDVAWN